VASIEGASVTDNPIAVFDRLARLAPPAQTPVLFDTVSVLGGSIAGLLAARVLADYARRVLIIEPDTVNVTGAPRAGTPHDRQLHGFMLGGQALVERWLPGIAQETVEQGGLLVDQDHFTVHLDGRPQMSSGDARILQCSRPFLEARIRSRVLALPAVASVAARATGLEYRDRAVSAVRYVADGIENVVPTDFVVDAMGRASKLSDWVAEAGFDRPQLQRMQTGVRYATAIFDRVPTPRYPDPAITVAQYPLRPGPGGVAAALVLPIENDQWMVGMATMGEGKPITSVGDLRSISDELPAHFAEAAGGAVTRELVTFHQADSRRRGFTGLPRFPARVVSVGDAVACYNATYSQGMSSAAFHASSLSEYLVGNPDLDVPAVDFFALQEVVVNALWIVSAGGDAARMDAIRGVDVPEDVQQQRWAMGQLMQATLTDEIVAGEFAAVAAMLAHPLSLADPALIERAVAANRQAATACTRP
jgi:flavin-dependent dehydrogenase